MQEKRFLISEAAKMLEVEDHVLRYWEKELNLHIKRNEMGHRYYEQRDIEMFTKIKELKLRGLALKGVKELIARSANRIESNSENYEDYKKEIAAASVIYDCDNLRDNFEVKNNYEKNKYNESKQTLEYKDDIDYKGSLEIKDSSDYSSVKKEKVVDFKLAQLQKIMNQAVKIAVKENNFEISEIIKGELTETIVSKMDNLIKEKEKREEDRYRRLDEVLRAVQRNNEIIANGIRKNKKKRGWFK